MPIVREWQAQQLRGTHVAVVGPSLKAAETLYLARTAIVPRTGQQGGAGIRPPEGCRALRLGAGARAAQQRTGGRHRQHPGHCRALTAIAVLGIPLTASPGPAIVRCSVQTGETNFFCSPGSKLSWGDFHVCCVCLPASVSISGTVLLWVKPTPLFCKVCEAGTSRKLYSWGSMCA